jgi:hypothetical protein
MEQYPGPSSHSGARSRRQIEEHEDKFLRDKNEQKGNIKTEDEEEPFEHD